MQVVNFSTGYCDFIVNMRYDPNAHARKRANAKDV